MRHLIFLILLFQVNQARAWDLEGFAGAQNTTYDDVEEANNSGLAARLKINFYNQNKGIFINVNGRGISPITSDLVSGYAWRTSGIWFAEGGFGGSVSAIYGANVALLVGTGYKVSNNLYINFPMIVAGSGIFWSPYIGYQF